MLKIKLLSAAWRLSDEGLIQKIKIISDLKLRASWGVTGNNRIPNNAQFSLLGTNNYPLNNVSLAGFSPSTIENRHLGWEQTVGTNFGLDFGILKNRISGSVDIYTKTTKDLLLRAPVSAISGYTDAKTGAKSSRVQYTKFLEKGSTIPVDRFDHPVNFPLIRYEDVLLMYAEILNEEAATPPAAAVTILNRIRTRAGVPSITPATKADFKLAMEQERQWEFCGEGLRWHDLVRTERALTVMNKYITDNAVPLKRLIDEHDLIYPIPQKELLINPGFWKQNPGYY